MKRRVITTVGWDRATLGDPPDNIPGSILHEKLCIVVIDEGNGLSDPEERHVFTCDNSTSVGFITYSWLTGWSQIDIVSALAIGQR